MLFKTQCFLNLNSWKKVVGVCIQVHRNKWRISNLLAYLSFFYPHSSASRIQLFYGIPLHQCYTCFRSKPENTNNAHNALYGWYWTTTYRNKTLFCFVVVIFLTRKLCTRLSNDWSGFWIVSNDRKTVLNQCQSISGITRTVLLWLCTL